MKLGIFGGTFNPVHNGHLINAEIIRSDFKLDRIIFIPAKSPVHKKIDGQISADDRCSMVELAVEKNSNMEVSTLELIRKGPSYTILTVNELLDTFKPGELYLIIGSDSFNEIDTWYKYMELVKLVSIIVMKRPGDLELRKDILEISGEVIVAENPLVEISSTCIRRRIREKKSIRYLVPGSVLEYINERGLYQN